MPRVQFNRLVSVLHGQAKHSHSTQSKQDVNCLGGLLPGMMTTGCFGVGELQAELNAEAQYSSHNHSGSMKSNFGGNSFSLKMQARCSVY